MKLTGALLGPLRRWGGVCVSLAAAAAAARAAFSCLRSSGEQADEFSISRRSCDLSPNPTLTLLLLLLLLLLMLLLLLLRIVTPRLLLK